MDRYFMKKYAMSEIGAKHLSKAIFSRTVLNLTKLFPPMIAFTFLFFILTSSFILIIAQKREGVNFF